MNSYCKRLLAAALSASMAMSAASLTSCKKEEDIANKSHSGMKISADSPWYEGKIHSVELGLDTTPDKKTGKPREFEYIFPQFAGADDKYICVRTSIEYSHPDSIYLNDGDWAENISIADINTGETVKVIDLCKALPKDYSVNDVSYRKGLLDLTVSRFDKEKAETHTRSVKYDPFEERIVEDTEEEDIYFQKQVTDFGDYRVEVILFVDDDYNSYNAINIVAPDGSTKKVELKDEGRALIYQPELLSLNKTQVLVCTGTETEDLFYKLDLESGKLTKENAKDYQGLDLRGPDKVNGRDGKTYYTVETGVYRYDLEKKKLEEALSYSWCDVSRLELTKLDVGQVTEDSFLLYSGSFEKGRFGFMENTRMQSFVFVNLKRADNPHAGKEILEMYVPYGWVNEAIYEKLVEFNNTNGKYFIEVTDRYTALYDEAMNGASDEDMAVLTGSSLMGNKICQDIMNGNGPDIILDADFFGALNYKEHLVDLSSYVADLDKDKYFTNILELSKKDSKLYRLPLSVGAYGICTDTKNAGKSGKGFTTEEYEKFLKETLNGKDLITGSQTYYFTELFNASRNKFIVNGKADFTGEDFASLAKFVKDNVPEKQIPQIEPEDGEDIQNEPEDPHALTPATIGYFGGYWSYFEDIERTTGDAGLLGLPSSDGKGPLAKVYNTVSVSVHAHDVGACCEFVKMLLEDDVQLGLAQSGCLPINREAFRKAGLEAVDYFNSVAISTYYSNDGKTPKNRIKFTPGHIDALEKTILSCTELSQQDPDIDKILAEEMPAYFTGQKDLKDVVKIAQNRVQKVLDERG